MSAPLLPQARCLPWCTTGLSLTLSRYQIFTKLARLRSCQVGINYFEVVSRSLNKPACYRTRIRPHSSESIQVDISKTVFQSHVKYNMINWFFKSKKSNYLKLMFLSCIHNDKDYKIMNAFFLFDGEISSSCVEIWTEGHIDSTLFINKTSNITIDLIHGMVCLN